jgi:hypothetical protein
VNSNSNSTVSAELGIQIFTSQQAIRPVAARLFYSREDPYAIRIAFHVELDQPVEWMFARDLLATGTEGRKGLGDITFWPSAGGGATGDVLNIALSSPFGKAHFAASAREISDFLRRTYQIVPVGEENEHIDIEAELNDLLRQAS